MSASAHDFESLLRQALAPVDPPADLAARLESTLVTLTQAAQKELDSWELTAMRDPRNWARPAAAVVVGAGAGTALVVLRVRSRHKTRQQQSRNLLDLVERTARDVAEEARRLFPGT
jgi:cobalamin biosynthesis protein CobD/CbiB